MRRTIWMTTGLIAAVLATGCMQKDGAKSEDEPEPTVLAAMQFADVKAKTQDAARAMEVYAYTRKLEFVADMTGELVAIQAEMDRLSAQVEASGDAARADVRADARVKLAAARGRWDEAKRRLDEAGDATEAGWDAMNAGFRQSYDELKGSIDQARQALSDKIEP